MTLTTHTKRGNGSANLIGLREPSLLKAFTHTTNPLIICTLEDGFIIDVSKGFEQLTGFDRNSIVGRDSISIGFWPNPRSRNEFVSSLREHKTVEDWETPYCTRAGDLRLCTMSADVIQIEDVQCIISVIRDVTEQKLMAQELQEEQEFSTNLLVYSPTPTWVSNPDFSIRYVNPALEKMTGFSSKELIGKKPPYPFWPEETTPELWRKYKIARRRGLTRVEHLFKKQNGERFWVEVSSVSVKCQAKLKYYISNWVDITEAKRLHENIKFYIRQITQVQEEERKRIARDLHDETAQALASLSVEVGEIAMTKGLTRRTTRQLEQLQQRIAGVVEGVRHLSHELRPGLLDKFGLVPSLELLIDELGIRSVLDCRVETSGIERRLSPDTEMVLFRIVQEALRNIRKHAHATSVMVRLQFTKNTVVVRISDNGLGFDVPRDFSGLVRYSKLGMIGMEERVHLVNGTLTFDSKRGKGTTVTVKIPAC